MEATADIAPSDRTALKPIPIGVGPGSTALPARTPKEALARSLAEYPADLLWTEVRELLSDEAAERVVEAAADAVRAVRA